MNAEERKQIPLYSGLFAYFPDALKEVAKVSYRGSKQHHPDEPMHWDRAKSGDELDALMRHLIDAGTRDKDGMRHSAKVAWRSLASLQKELELAGEATTAYNRVDAMQNMQKAKRKK